MRQIFLLNINGVIFTCCFLDNAPVDHSQWFQGLQVSLEQVSGSALTTVSGSYAIPEK